MSDLPFSYLVRKILLPNKAGLPVVDFEFTRNGRGWVFEQLRPCDDYNTVVLSSQAPDGNTWTMGYDHESSNYWTYCMNKLISKIFGLSKTEVHCWSFSPTFFFKGRPIDLFGYESEATSFNLQATWINSEAILSCFERPSSGLIPFFQMANGTYFTSILSDFVFIEIPKFQKPALSQFRLVISLSDINESKKPWSTTTVLSCSTAIKLTSGGPKTIYALPWNANAPELQRSEQVKWYIRKSITWCEKRCRHLPYPKPCPAQVILPADMGLADSVRISIHPENNAMALHADEDPFYYSDTGGVIFFDPYITVLGCKRKYGMHIDPYKFFGQ